MIEDTEVAERAEEISSKFSKRDVASVLIILFTIAAAFTITGWYGGARIENVDQRLINLEEFKNHGLRCTAQDCQVLSARISDIEDRLDSIVKTVDTLPKKAPPKWFEEDVLEVKAMVNELRQEVIKLTILIVQHSSKVRPPPCVEGINCPDDVMPMKHKAKR